MRLRNLLPAALAVAMTMTACVTSSPPASGLPRPLPGELAVQCPPPVAVPGNNPDAALVALKTLYDQYGTCAGRYVDLLNWLQAPPTHKKELP